MAGWMTQTEIEEQALDFDENNYLDGGYWEERYAEERERKAEEKAFAEYVESQAEITEYRTQGYM